jgi:hypothetical protein
MRVTDDLALAPQTDPVSIYRQRDGVYATDLLTASLVCSTSFRILPTTPVTRQRSVRTSARTIGRRT